MPKYYNEITKEILDYPEEAAALFPVLKPVPSERSKAAKTEETKPETHTSAKDKGDVDAK